MNVAEPLPSVAAFICWVFAILAFLMAMFGFVGDAEATRIIALMAVSMIGLQE